MEKIKTTTVNEINILPHYKEIYFKDILYHPDLLLDNQNIHIDPNQIKQIKKFVDIQTSNLIIYIELKNDSIYKQTINNKYWVLVDEVEPIFRTIH